MRKVADMTVEELKQLISAWSRSFVSWVLPEESVVGGNKVEEEMIS